MHKLFISVITSANYQVAQQRDNVEGEMLDVSIRGLITFEHHSSKDSSDKLIVTIPQEVD